MFLKSFLNSLQYYFYVLFFWPRGMWDLSSPTRDHTPTTCIGSRVVTTGPPGKSLNATLDTIYQLPSIMVHAHLFSDSVIPSYILHLLNRVITFGQINIQCLYYWIYANVTPSPRGWSRKGLWSNWHLNLGLARSVRFRQKGLGCSGQEEQ